MAGPRIFVPGPSVNPSIGTPAQFISLIDDTIKSNRRARIADERTAQDKVFRQQTADLNTRKQDFTEAAPERAELLRTETLARDNEKAQIVANSAEGLQFAGGDRFDTLRGTLEKDPRFAQLDEAGKLAAQNEYILNNPAALTDPTKFGSELRQTLAASGKFTAAEVDAAVASEISRRYPTADPDLIKSMLAKPKDFISSGGQSVNIGGKLFSSKGSSGGLNLITGAGGPDDRQTVLDRQASLRNLPDNPSTLPDLLGGGRLEIPGGDLSVSKQDLSNMIGILAQEGINSPTAVEAALGKAFTDNNDLKGAYDYRTDSGKNKLIADAKKAQDTEERRKGGDLSQLGAAAGIFSPADAVNAAKTYNSGLLASLTPQAFSNAEVASTFLNTLGEAQAQAPTNTTRQGSDGGGPVVAPEIVPDAPVIAPAVDAVNPEAEFQIGGPAQEQVIADRLFDTFVQPAVDLATTSPILEAGKLGNKLIDTLTPPGQGVLGDLRPKSPKAQRQAAVDNLSSSEKASALKEARKLSKAGKLGLAEGEGRSRDDSLLIAYFQYLEGQRN